MNWTTRVTGAALLVGAVIGVSGTFVPAAPGYAAPARQAAPRGAIKIENKQLADLITGATADAKAGRYEDALAKAKQADGMGGKPAALTVQIHQMIVAYSIQAKDYNSALAELDKLIASGEGDKTKNLSDALNISLQMKNQQRANGYLNQLGENLKPDQRLYIAQAYVGAKRYKEALDMVKPLRDMPTENLLLFLQDMYNQMGDGANRRAVLEQLVANYPKPKYWHDLLQLARNERGLSDEQSMDIYRLRLAVDDLKTQDEYSEMAQVAIVAGYPNEAKTVLDKAAAAKLLAGERSARLVKMTTDRVAADNATVADLQKKASADPNASVKLGLVDWTYGKYPEAEAAIRSGMKGKLADPEGAKVALGHVLLSEGKTQEAIAAFNSVARNSKEAGIARLWSIYARSEPRPAVKAAQAGKRG
jgi:hypothetical protein